MLLNGAWQNIQITKWFNYIKVCEKKTDQSKCLLNGQYSVNKDIRFKTPMLGSSLCDDSDAYIIVKGMIDLLAAAANENNKAQKDVFKNNSQYRSCI